MCVFVDVPVDGSAAATRWRRLARSLADLGVATVVVCLDASPEDQAELGAELGAPVVTLDTQAPRTRRRALKAILRPWRSWPPARIDAATARRGWTR